MRIRLGAYELEKRGAARHDWRDPYYLAVALSWPWFLLSAVVAFAILDSLFALLYLLQPGSIADARSGSFLDHFFFGMETMATVGYGDLHPATIYGHAIASVQMIFGIGFNALTTGLVVVRFCRPRAKIRYADQVVVTRHQGQRVLMIRIANERLTPLTDATARLSALFAEISSEGQSFRTIQPLPLVRDRLPIFGLTWSLIHTLDETSPLRGYDMDRLRNADVRLFLTIEARDPLLAATVHETFSYSADDVVFGMRYADAVSVDAEGRPLADLTLISVLEPEVAEEIEPVAVATGQTAAGF